MDFAFAMGDYVIKEPELADKSGCLLLSKPSGFDLNRFFPAIWRSPSVTDAQTALPLRCDDHMIITSAQRNAECRQLTFVQNYFKQSPQSQEETAVEFAQDLRKNLSISTLSNLLFSNFEIYVLKSKAMSLFSQAKEDNITLEQALLWDSGTLKLWVSEGSVTMLSPYERDYLGFFLFPRIPQKKEISLAMLKGELLCLEEYHEKNRFAPTVLG